jgi:putative ABC transport system permease protein
MRPEHWLFTIPLRLRSLFRWPQADLELDEELRDHLERKTEEYVAKGMALEEARRRARLDLGGIEKCKEECRDARRVDWIQDLIQDLRFALRTFRKSPGFPSVAVLTLALGLAANTAIFSVINGVLLQPLEYPNPSQLAAIELFVPKLAQKFPMVPVNPTAYLGWRNQAKSLAGIGLVEDGVTLNLTSGGEPELLSADAVTANLFDVLGVTPLLGRNFSPDADQSGHNHEVILTNALWQGRFHGDPNIIGQAIALDGSPHTVVGVLPSALHFPQGYQLMPMGSANEPELFVPAVFEKWELAPDAGFGWAAIARLKPGMSQEQVTAELNVILSRQLGSQSFMPNPRTVMIPLRDMIARSAKRGLWVLLAAVLAVLLIICVNLANLALARATAREREAAIRTALGASHGRLLRQTLTEMLLLGLLGGTLGLVLAHWALVGLLAIAPVSLPRLHNIRLDRAVLGFTLVVSVLSVVLSGLLPARRLARTNPQDALRSGRAPSADGTVRLRSREFLVGLETALSAMLLIVAGLLLASFLKLDNVPKGFAVENLLTVNVQLSEAQYTQRQQRTEFWSRVLSSTTELPGVESSAVTDWLPLSGEINDDPINLPGDTRPAAERPFASYRHVSPAYFKALGIPLLRGRELTWADAGTPAVVISEATATTVWPGLNPIGQRFDVDSSSGFTGFQVVGVVGDTRCVSLFKEPAPMVYRLYESGLTGSLILRTQLRATSVAPELHRAIWKIDPSVAIPSVRSMGQIVSTSLAPRRFETLLTSLFAAAALLLACLGIYGVVSYSVARRTREIGIRMALGARGADMLRRVIGQGMTPALLGLGAGIIGALGFTRVLSSLLFGVKPTDLLTFTVVSLILTGVAAVASYIPARRAMRVDPMAALRYE